MPFAQNGLIFTTVVATDKGKQIKPFNKTKERTRTMSKNFKGYMGDQIGKLGTAVGRRWKGKMVYSAYQGRVRNPRTESQRLVRARLALLSQTGSQLMPVIGVSLAAWARQRQTTELCGFVKLNYSGVAGSTADSVELNTEGIVLSRGGLRGVDFGTPVFDTPGTVQVSVADSWLGVYGTSASDTVMLAAYCPDAGTSTLSDGTARRGDSSVSLAVPSGWQGQKVHVWGFVTGASGKVSNSVYVGAGNVE